MSMLLYCCTAKHCIFQYKLNLLLFHFNVSYCAYGALQNTWLPAIQSATVNQSAKIGCQVVPCQRNAFCEEIKFLRNDLERGHLDKDDCQCFTYGAYDAVSPGKLYFINFVIVVRPRKEESQGHYTKSHNQNILLFDTV